MITRRTLLAMTGGGVALAAFGTASNTAHAETFPLISPGPEWTLLGQAPDALALNPWSGQGIRTMFLDGGRIYYGYGDYGTNPGTASGKGINVSYFDLASQSFQVAMVGYATEEINTFRRIGASLAVPSVDPALRTASCATSVGGWHEATGIPSAEHVFDVARGLTDQDLFICGSANVGGVSSATIWRSLDGGKSWNLFFQEPETSGYQDGYERFYWMARVGNYLYVRADLGTKVLRAAPMRRYDLSTARWTTMGATGLKLPNTTYFTLAQQGVRQASDVQVVGSNIYFGMYDYLYMYNGKATKALTTAAGGYRKMAFGSDGNLYATIDTGVYRVSGTTLTKVATGSCYTPIVVNGMIYTSGNQGALYRKAL